MMPAPDHLYGRAVPVRESTPVYRWLARGLARPWPDSLRMLALADGWAAALPVYAPGGALVGSWQQRVSEDGLGLAIELLGDIPAEAAVRLIPAPARYMALIADIPEALRQWARLGGPIWCPPAPGLLRSVVLPAEAQGLAICWAMPETEAGVRAAQNMRDAVRIGGGQAIAGPPKSAELMLPGRPGAPAPREATEGPPLDPIFRPDLFN